MKNISDKAKIVVGWLILVLGLSVIGYGLFLSYQVFKRGEEVPQIFVSKFAQTEKVENIYQSQSDLSKPDVTEVMSDVFKDILPLEYIPVFLNISVFTIFIFILITGGFKISTLGIKLLFNEKV